MLFKQLEEEAHETLAREQRTAVDFMLASQSSSRKKPAVEIWIVGRDAVYQEGASSTRLFLYYRLDCHLPRRTD